MESKAVVLTTEQIDHLFDFVRSKYVRYIDVQHELVDHLASAIEDEMTGQPSLSFESALSAVYGRFPITGFAQFVKEKERAMTAYWRRRQMAYLKTYFTLPKVLMTMAIALVSWTAYSAGYTWLSVACYLVTVCATGWGMGESRPLRENKQLVLFVSLMSVAGLVLIGDASELSWPAGIGGALVLGALMLFQVKMFKHLEAQKLRESYLFIQSFFSTSVLVGVTSMTMFPVYASNFDIFAQDHPLAAGFLTLFTTISLVGAHAMRTHFRHMLREEASKKYPHLEMPEQWAVAS